MSKAASKQYIQKLAVSAVFVALATVLSLVKVFKMPLGGSVTLFSMLPIVMISVLFGLKWGLGSAFVYSLIQFVFGLADGILGWGLTPLTLVGVIFLDYILAFTVLGFAGAFAKKGYAGICIGVVMVMVLRFLCHFTSGVIFFANFDQFVVFGAEFIGRPILYSVCYNGLYMLPEAILTTAGAVGLFRLQQVKKILKI